MALNPTTPEYLVLNGVLIDSTTNLLSTDLNEFIDFFQNGPIALHWLSKTGHIIWANKTELETLGYTREEYIGHHIMEVSFHLFFPSYSHSIPHSLTQLILTHSFNQSLTLSIFI